MTLGQKLKERRLDKNLTLRDLAKLVKTDFTYLSKIENDKTDHPPSEDLLGRLSVQLETDLDELLSLSGQVPEKFREALTRDQGAFAFLRSAIDSKLSESEWAALKDSMEKRNQEKKKE